MRLPIAAALTLTALAPAQARTLSGAQPVELGAISWYRDFDAATAEAKRLDRPLLVLFQEVPG